MRPAIPHNDTRSGFAGGRPLAGLVGLISAVALAVWIWGLLTLPHLPAILLWWWPSLLAGALAGVAACVAVEAARLVVRVRRGLQVKAGRRLSDPTAGPPEAVGTPLSPAE